MSEENQNQRPIPAPEQADPNYKETLLLYNEKNGAVEAVSKLDEQNGRYKVSTTQPLRMTPTTVQPQVLMNFFIRLNFFQ